MTYFEYIEYRTPATRTLNLRMVWTLILDKNVPHVSVESDVNHAGFIIRENGCVLHLRSV